MDLSSNQEPTTQATKVCTRCGKELPVDQFSRRSSSADGLQMWCKSCQRESQRISRSNRQLPPPPVKGDPSSPLAEFTPRQLIEELHNRGYRGELQYLYTIKV